MKKLTIRVEDYIYDRLNLVAKDNSTSTNKVVNAIVEKYINEPKEINHLKEIDDRLEKLEEIANSYEGVDKSFAIQAGREVRIMVKPENVSDEDIHLLARDMTKRIEDELEYPGQIKVSIIRETRAIEYAK